ncbi:MAG TPA: DUF5666 domain-containing protein [Acidobacteriaceae bacterium]
MQTIRKNVLVLMLAWAAPLLWTAPLLSILSLSTGAQDTQSSAAKPVSFLGTVQSISGKSITVKSDAGLVMEVTIQDDARLLRIEPGQKSLQEAAPFSLSDLQVGDRVLARGAGGADGKQLTATMLVAIKKADIAQKQEKDREDWQKRGEGGLVKSVDPVAGTVTISTAGGRRTVTIQTSKSTIIRRYAPGSVKFDDAKPSALAEIQPGDQARARGDRSADGQSLTAEEIVSGSFRNIAGTVISADPAALTLTITDLATKHPVIVQLTPDTQIKKLDPVVAQRIALRLKGGAPNGPAASGTSAGAGGPAGPAPQGARPSAEGGPGSRSGGEGGGDPQQFLARAPDATLKDFPKGSAVILVATEGAANGSHGTITAITLIGGVEPMLQASASGSQAFLSSAWNLGGGGGEQAQQ